MRSQKSFSQFFPFSWRDLLVSAIILSLATIAGIFLQIADGSEGFASPVYVLAVLLISHLTTGYLFGLISSFVGMICVNFIFTYPYWDFNFTISGYPVTFISFLVVSVVTCTLTTQVHQQERLRAENEKEKLRTNLLRSVSHDIRTPLTSIIGATSAILENPGLSKEDQHELLEDARSEAQWLIQVVENLLSITRIGTDATARITKDQEAVEEIVGDAIQKFRKRFPSIHVSVTVPDTLLLVPMDPILIVQVLSNLFENSVIHGNASQISISVLQDDHFAHFIVQDFGSGIPEDILPTLFTGKLTHTDTSVNDGKRNMGLGLSVCNAIVRAHGGTMRAQNLSNGAEFTFSLPLEK